MEKTHMFNSSLAVNRSDFVANTPINNSYFSGQIPDTNSGIKPYAAVVIILAIFATVLNLVSIAAIFQVRYKWTGVFKFMFSLMLSDITISTSVILLLFISPENVLNGRITYSQRMLTWCSFTIGKALFTMALNVTLLNLMAMAVDHYIAIIHPLKYSNLLSDKKSTIMIIILWIIAYFTGFSNFFSPLWDLGTYKKYSNYNFCEFIWLSAYNEEYTTFVIALLCTCVMVPIYGKIYCTAQGIQRTLVSRTYCGRKALDRSLINRRTLITTLMILGCFALCWLPMCCFQVISIILIKFKPTAIHNFKVLQVIDEALLCLLLLNAICDPLIYAVRIAEVRQGFLKLLHKLSPRDIKEKLDEPKSVLNYRKYSVNSFMLSDYKDAITNGVSDSNGVTDDVIQEETAAFDCSAVPSDIIEEETTQKENCEP